MMTDTILAVLLVPLATEERLSLTHQIWLIKSRRTLARRAKSINLSWPGGPSSIKLSNCDVLRMRQAA